MYRSAYKVSAAAYPDCQIGILNAKIGVHRPYDIRSLVFLLLPYVLI